MNIRYRNNMPQEFYKSIKHNGKLYTLHSIYDDVDKDSDLDDLDDINFGFEEDDLQNSLSINNALDMLSEPQDFLPNEEGSTEVDPDILGLTDDLMQLYDTGLFD